MGYRLATLGAIMVKTVTTENKMTIVTPVQFDHTGILTAKMHRT
jgi:hypothetical protein